MRAAEVMPQAWRNGGGKTRELIAWPSVADWALRISLADIDVDGPFSAFAGVQRWFAVIEGAGVTLAFDNGERIVRPGDAPLGFDGASAPGCRLLAGPTRDLNLMARGGDAALRNVERGVAWREAFAQRGLFTAVPGRWRCGGSSQHLDAQTLLWVDEAIGSGDAAWRFDADDEPAGLLGWWLGYTPNASPLRDALSSPSA